MSTNESKVLAALQGLASDKKIVCATVQTVADTAGLIWDDANKSLCELANHFGLVVRFAGVAGDPDEDEDDGVVVYQYFLDGVTA